MNGHRFRAPRAYVLILSGVGATILGAAAIAGAVIGTGTYNIGADAAHTRPVHALLETLRDRSIVVRARNITPPSDLGDPERIARGAGLYDEM